MLKTILFFGNRKIKNKNMKLYIKNTFNIHRNSGPAIIYHGGAKEWRKNDGLNRKDGPCEIYPNGLKSWMI